MSEQGSEEEASLETVFEIRSDIDSSGEESPIENWSSLALVYEAINEKILAYEAGLYEPGSGEICTKYIAVSDSSVLRHPYYTFPAVQDPGIEDALLEPEEKVVYPSDGQEKYISICIEMDECPVNIFYKGLLESSINLSYYCVDSPGMIAMAEALKNNEIVESFNLTDNFLSKDACYHLGDMFKTNSTLRELILSGCQIGPTGLRRLLAGLNKNKSLRVLNLDKNSLSDEGGIQIGEALFKGFHVTQLHLSYNRLGTKTAVALAEAFEFFNTLSHLDLSWNNFFSPVGTVTMLSRFEENKNLQELDLSWNSLAGPRIAAAIKTALNAPNLQVLNLSNNSFFGDAIDIISENLNKSKKLRILNLSYNPLTVADAYKMISTMRKVAVKVQELYLDNVNVDTSFLLVLERMKHMKSKKNVIVTVMSSGLK